MIALTLAQLVSNAAAAVVLTAVPVALLLTYRKDHP